MSDNTEQPTTSVSHRAVQVVAAVGCIGIIVWVGSMLWEQYSVFQHERIHYPNAKVPPLTRSQFIAKFPIVPAEEISGGGTGIDGIPALTDPEFVAAAKADFLKAKDRVIGLSANNQAIAFPLRIMNYHEIVNTTLNDIPVAVTYSPWCDSAAVFDRRSKTSDIVHEFGVSGLLYKSNVLLYNRAAGEDSLWSQLTGESICGPEARNKLDFLPCEMTTWNNWLTRYPNSKVLSTNTGYKRGYGHNPFANYGKTDELKFTVFPASDVLPVKHRVLGIWVDDQFRCYPAKLFEGETTSISDSLADKEFTVIVDMNTRSLRVEDADEGVSWLYTYWFAWYAVHPETEVYGFQEAEVQPDNTIQPKPAAADDEVILPGTPPAPEEDVIPAGTPPTPEEEAAPEGSQPVTTDEAIPAGTPPAPEE